MLRKTLVALTAVAALGSVALAPTSASAGGGKFFKHGHLPPRDRLLSRLRAGRPELLLRREVHPVRVKIVKVCRWY